MGDILNQIYQHYEQLDGEMKAQLPLKQIWVPISEN
jgi:predicted Mrr-cat superfamily restriction endonuclease